MRRLRLEVRTDRPWERGGRAALSVRHLDETAGIRERAAVGSSLPRVPVRVELVLRAAGRRERRAEPHRNTAPSVLVLGDTRAEPHRRRSLRGQAPRVRVAGDRAEQRCVLARHRRSTRCFAVGRPARPCVGSARQPVVRRAPGRGSEGDDGGDAERERSPASDAPRASQPASTGTRGRVHPPEEPPGPRPSRSFGARASPPSFGELVEPHLAPLCIADRPSSRAASRPDAVPRAVRSCRVCHPHRGRGHRHQGER